MMPFEIPPSDLDEFHALPKKVQRQIDDTLHCLEVMEGCGGAKGAEAAALPRRGFSGPQLRRKWFDFKKHGWRGLINLRKLGKGLGIPQEFQDWWRDALGRQRAAVGGVSGNINLAKAETFRHFIREWRAGKSLPGLGTWRDWWREVVRHRVVPAEFPWAETRPQPPKLSYRNLARIAVNTGELAGQRRGAGALRKHVRGVAMDFGALRPLEVLVWDDARLDFQVIDVGSGEVCEVQLIAAMDLATRMIVGWVLRARVPREDGTKVSLARRDVLTLAARILGQYGYPREYQSVWVMENATATVNEEEAGILRRLTAGQVEVRWTSMFRGRAVLGGFAEDASGNPNGKPIESFWRAAWIELGREPGYTGSRYQLRPADLTGRTREALQLLAAGRGLPADVQEHLRADLMTVDEVQTVVEAAFQRLSARQHHTLQGFAQMTQWKFRAEPASCWRNLTEERPEVSGQEFKLMCEVRAVMESPAMRLERLLREHAPAFAPVAESAAAQLLADKTRLIYSGGRYFAPVIGGKRRLFAVPDLVHAKLAEGQPYWLYYDADRVSAAWLMDDKGGYIGRIDRATTVGYLDQDKLAGEIAAKEAAVKRTLESVRRRQPAADVERRLDTLDAREAAFRPGMALPAVGKAAESGGDQMARQMAAAKQRRGTGAELRRRAREETEEMAPAGPDLRMLDI